MTPYAPLSRPLTYCPGVKLPEIEILSSNCILVKKLGSKYDSPNVLLYVASPFDSLPLDTTISVSELNPAPLSNRV